MYRVFIVDDEELVIESLRASVNWSEYGFQVVDHALSGREAFEKIVGTKPDIVFTDIRMPGMNGLELIQKLKESGTEILFVVISGYAEFAYAQKAVNYGAIGYCLKPFDDVEIIGYLKKARAILDKQGDAYEILDLIEDQSAGALESLQRALENHGVFCGRQQEVRIAVSIGKNKLQPDPPGARLVLKMGFDKYAYFVEGKNEEQILSFLCSDNAQGILGIGLSQSVDQTEKVKYAIHSADIAAYCYFITGRKEVSLYREPAATEQGEYVRQLEEAVGSKNILQINESLDHIGRLFEQGYLNIKHALIVFNTVTMQIGKIRNLQEEEYIYSFDKLAARFCCVRDMLQYLKEFSSAHSEAELNSVLPKVSHTFKQILRYVKDNYLKDISIHSISNDLNLNASYISQLFRKELDTTFTEYLSRLRIEDACKMLDTTDASILEIAEKVGYTDYFYFSRIFKKYMGKSPSSHRSERKRIHP